MPEKDGGLNIARSLRCILLALAIATPTLARAASVDDAQAVFARFLDAFTAADIDATVNTFWPDALLWGTTSANLAATPDAVRAYFKPMAARKPNEWKATSIEMSAVGISDARGIRARIRFRDPERLCIRCRRRRLSRPDGQQAAGPAGPGHQDRAVSAAAVSAGIYPGRGWAFSASKDPLRGRRVLVRDLLPKKRAHHKRGRIIIMMSLTPN